MRIFKVILFQWLLGLAGCSALLWSNAAFSGPRSNIDTNIPHQIKEEIKKRLNTSDIGDLLKKHDVPGLSVAIIKDRKLVFAKGYGLVQAGSKDKINADTLFSVGSISKVGAATITLGLVDQQLLDLNTDVNQYLNGWRVPKSRLTQNNPVTLSRILSHTAGLSVHGFADFQPGEPLPTTIDILNGTNEAKNTPVRLIFEPGSDYKYSGGGTTVQQLVLEETLKNGFPKIAKDELFKPLAMSRSTYQNPVPQKMGNIAKAHNRWGSPRALPRGYEAMPEMAASGLWTTPTDLSKLIIALMDSYSGKQGSLLTQKTAQKMMTRIGPGEFGLGPILKTENTFQHGGSNDSYKAFFKGDLISGNGYVLFTNGASGSRLINELREAFDSVLM